MADLRDFTGKNRKFTGDSGLVPSDTTATTGNRVAETGRFRFNSTINLMEYYNGTSWISIDSPPTVASASPTSVDEDGTTTTFTITGDNFSSSGLTASIFSAGGAEIAFDSVTRDSSTQLTAVLTNSNLGTISEPYDIKVINGSGLAATLASAFNVNEAPTWSTSAGNIGSAVKGNAISTITVAATDPEGGDVDYYLSAGSLPTGLSLAAETGQITGTYTGSSATTFNFTIEAHDSASNVTSRAFSMTTVLPDGTTPALAVAAPNDIYLANNSFSDGNFYINTPDGGIQQCYCINAGSRGWALVGRFSADAKDSVQATLGSVRGLKDVSQGGTNYWSADFGTFDTTDEQHYMMAWGSPNFPGRSASGVNWIMNIPQTGYSTFRQWMANSPSDSPSQAATTSVEFNTYQGPFSGLQNKQGVLCDGAKDGPFNGSRWNNPSFRETRIADPTGGNYVSQGGLSNNQGSVWYMDASDDAKWAVHASDVRAGQDINASQYFGIDDNQGPGHYDVGTGSEAQGSTRRDYSNAVTFWLS